MTAMVENIKIVGKTKINEKNVNGHLYTTEVIQEAIDRLNGRELICCQNSTDTITDLRKTTHIASNFRIKDDYLECDISFINNQLRDAIKEMENYPDLSIGMVGLGNLNADAVVSDFTLLNIHILD